MTEKQGEHRERFGDAAKTCAGKKQPCFSACMKEQLTVEMPIDISECDQPETKEERKQCIDEKLVSLGFTPLRAQ